MRPTTIATWWLELGAVYGAAIKIDTLQPECLTVGISIRLTIERVRKIYRGINIVAMHKPLGEGR